MKLSKMSEDKIKILVREADHRCEEEEDDLLFILEEEKEKAIKEENKIFSQRL